MEDYLKELTETRKALLNMLEDFEEARKIAEEEKEKTRAIVVSLTDGLIVLDKGERVSLINPQGESLLGIKIKDIEGKSWKELTEKSPFKEINQLILKNKNLFREEVSLEEPKEEVLEATTVFLASRKERIIILHDISREKLIDRMKTEFLSLVAHQLRSPVSATKWTLRMLLDGDFGKITKKQREFIGKTYQVNERMINLINDLLNVTRIEEGRYLYKPTPEQLEDLVESVIKSLEEEIKKKKIKLEFKKPKEKFPPVKVDSEKIKLVIDNLLTNAIKYTPSEGEVTINLNFGKKEIEFSIKDTGIGIPKDQQEKVFSKFFRGANVMRMGIGGTGLGLFITKNIVEAHKGRIWFESKKEKGTTFHFTLPIEKL